MRVAAAFVGFGLSFVDQGPTNFGEVQAASFFQALLLELGR